MATHQDFTIGRILWPVVPSITVACGIILTILPYGTSTGPLATPAFALIPVYFWASYRPNLLPIPIVFVFGLAQDLLTYGPFGLWGVVFLITYGVTLWQRDQIEGQAFRVQWLGFAAAASVGLVSGWFLASVYAAKFLGPLPFVAQAIATAVVFPPIAWLFLGFERAMASALRH